jgi:hypothetical protein
MLLAVREHLFEHLFMVASSPALSRRPVFDQCAPYEHADGGPHPQSSNTLRAATSSIVDALTP